MNILDRVAQVIAQLWRSFEKGFGLKVNLSISFHLQTNGQAERTNQKSKDMLSARVIDFNDDWDDCVPLVEFAYNNNYHSIIHIVPYESLHRRTCRSPVGWFWLVKFS